MKTITNTIHTADLGRWQVTATESVSLDWEYYSKSWHRTHGPRRAVESRTVEFRSAAGARRVVHPDAWRGDWLARACLDAGLVKAKRKTRAPLSVRLNCAYDAELVREVRGHKIYQRTLMGTPVDFVIVSPMGLTYHDEDRKQLIPGLRAKLRCSLKRAKLPGTTRITWALCKKLGFCDAGIRAFADAFGLDTNAEYSPEQIEARVRSNPATAAPFLPELRILADAIGHPVAEFN